MDGQTTDLRAARPTPADGLVFARYLDQAAEGFNRFMLGREAPQIISRAFVEEDHDLCYRNVTFAERGEVVGMYLAYSAEQHHATSNEPLQQAAGRWRLRMRLINGLLRPLIHIADSIVAGDCYLHAIAVAPEHRGEGLADVLMDGFEAEARAVGSSRLCLDVSAANASAIRFYRRRGWMVDGQWPRRVAIPGLKLYRMVKSVV